MVSPVHRRLLALAPGARRLLGGAVVCGLLAAVALVVQAGALARIVDGAAFGSGVPEGALLALGAAVGARALLAALTEWLGRRAAERALDVLRRRVAEHVLSARVRRVEDARRGELATAAVHGVDALGEFYAKAVPQMVLAAVVPVGLVGVLLWHNAVVALLLGLTLPLAVVFMILVGRESAARIGERRVALGVLGTHFLDVVRGLPALRAHARAEAQAETLAAIGERYRLESVAALRVAFLSALVLELLAMVGTAIAAAVVGVQLASGALAFETGLFVLLLAPEVYVPLRLAGQRYHAAEDGAAAAATLFEVLDGAETRPGAAAGGVVPARAVAAGARPGAAAGDVAPARAIAAGARPGAAAGDVAPALAIAAGAHPGAVAGDIVPTGVVPAGSRRGAAARDVGPTRAVADPSRYPLVLRDVVVEGGAGRPPSLDGADATFAPGRLTALAGPSGAGKSTVLSLLAGLREPDAGSVTCGGRALAGPAWWPNVAWLDQRPAVQRGPLRDTLELWSAGELDLALRRAGALEVVAGLPHGIDTVVGPGGRPLAGGQVQRLTLAAVLASRAPLLLLDEPTAHLDPESAAWAAAGIRGAAAGRTAIVATHDPALIAVCDDVLEVRDGRVVTSSASGKGSDHALGVAA